MKNEHASPTAPGRLRGWLAVPVLGVLAGLALGFGIGRWLGPVSTGELGRSATLAEARADALAAEIAVLRETLDRESRARDALAQRVAGLISRIDPPTAGGAAVETVAEVEGDSAPVGELDPDPSRQPGASGDVWFDSAALVEAGFDRSQVEGLREQWQEYVMRKLDLVDRGMRNRTAVTPQHRRQLRSLEREFREDLGDQAYDVLLFATGRSNRVRVRGLIDRSPGDRAGLRAGDAILSYAGRRIFEAQELRRATAAGERGELVQVEIDRNGELSTLYIPRGPMGALLEASRALPADG